MAFGRGYLDIHASQNARKETSRVSFSNVQKVKFISPEPKSNGDEDVKAGEKLVRVESKTGRVFKSNGVKKRGKIENVAGKNKTVKLSEVIEYDAIKNTAQAANCHVNLIDDLSHHTLAGKIQTADMVLLCNNDISSFAQMLQLSRNFVNMSSLSLANNLITEAAVLEPLKSCVKLTRLYMDGNPLCRWPYYRARVIAALPYLMYLDAIEITDSERVQGISVFKKEATLLSMMIGNAIMIMKLQHITTKLLMHGELIQNIYGRASVFNRYAYFPAGLLSLQDNSDGLGLDYCVHRLMEYLDSCMYIDDSEKSLLISGFVTKIQDHWLQWRKNNQPTKQLSEEAWENGVSLLMTHQQTELSRIIGLLEETRAFVTERVNVIFKKAFVEPSYQHEMDIFVSPNHPAGPTSLLDSGSKIGFLSPPNTSRTRQPVPTELPKLLSQEISDLKLIESIKIGETGEFPENEDLSQHKNFRSTKSSASLKNNERKEIDSKDKKNAKSSNQSTRSSNSTSFITPFSVSRSPQVQSVSSVLEADVDSKTRQIIDLTDLVGKLQYKLEQYRSENINNCARAESDAEKLLNELHIAENNSRQWKERAENLVVEMEKMELEYVKIAQSFEKTEAALEDRLQSKDILEGPISDYEGDKQLISKNRLLDLKMYYSIKVDKLKHEISRIQSSNVLSHVVIKRETEGSDWDKDALIEEYKRQLDKLLSTAEINEDLYDKPDRVISVKVKTIHDLRNLNLILFIWKKWRREFMLSQRSRYHGNKRLVDRVFRCFFAWKSEVNLKHSISRMAEKCRISNFKRLFIIWRSNVYFISIFERKIVIAKTFFVRKFFIALKNCSVRRLKLRSVQFILANSFFLKSVVQFWKVHSSYSVFTKSRKLIALKHYVVYNTLSYFKLWRKLLEDKKSFFVRERLVIDITKRFSSFKMLDVVTWWLWFSRAKNWKKKLLSKVQRSFFSKWINMKALKQTDSVLSLGFNCSLLQGRYFRLWRVKLIFLYAEKKRNTIADQADVKFTTLRFWFRWCNFFQRRKESFECLSLFRRRLVWNRWLFTMDIKRKNAINFKYAENLWDKINYRVLRRFFVEWGLLSKYCVLNNGLSLELLRKKDLFLMTRCFSLWQSARSRKLLNAMYHSHQALEAAMVNMQDSLSIMKTEKHMSDQNVVAITVESKQKIDSLILELSKREEQVHVLSSSLQHSLNQNAETQEALQKAVESLDIAKENMFQLEQNHNNVLLMLEQSGIDKSVYEQGLKEARQFNMDGHSLIEGVDQILRQMISIVENSKFDNVEKLRSLVTSSIVRLRSLIADKRPILGFKDFGSRNNSNDSFHLSHLGVSGTNSSPVKDTSKHYGTRSDGSLSRLSSMFIPQTNGSDVDLFASKENIPDASNFTPSMIATYEMLRGLNPNTSVDAELLRQLRAQFSKSDFSGNDQTEPLKKNVTFAQNTPETFYQHSVNSCVNSTPNSTQPNFDISSSNNITPSTLETLKLLQRLDPSSPNDAELVTLLRAQLFTSSDSNSGSTVN